MKFKIKTDVITQQKTDCLIVGVYTEQLLSPSAQVIDEASGGLLTKLFEQHDLQGKLGETVLLHAVQGTQSERVLVVGCGEQATCSARNFQKIIFSMMSALTQTGAKQVCCCLPELEIKDLLLTDKCRLAAQYINVSGYCFHRFKTEKAQAEKALASITLQVSDYPQLADCQLAVSQGQAVANGMRLCRDVANMPPNICTPAYLAEQARQLAQDFPEIETEVIDEKQMAQLGMHAYLAVARGSENEAMMSVIRYQGHQDQQAKPIVLVGKGLTFDAGGISLKPGEGMDEMKYDMCGAASVLGVMHAVASLKLPLNVIGVVAGAENMPDGRAYRPGDIIESMAGKSIEVLNTDAEGRLVLCDALTYVKRFSPEVVIDIATLTGACVIALGHHISGLISSDDALSQALLAAGEKAQDLSWRLPLTQDYLEQIESPFADIANIGGRPAGTITAGAFLSHFTKDYKWAHLDIAGTAWTSGKDKGATGRPVPLLVQFIKDRVAT